MADGKPKGAGNSGEKSAASKDKEEKKKVITRQSTLEGLVGGRKVTFKDEAEVKKVWDELGAMKEQNKKIKEKIAKEGKERDIEMRKIESVVRELKEELKSGKEKMEAMEEKVESLESTVAELNERLTAATERQAETSAETGE
ncbi:GRIP and coiled-coil domain-containing protein 2-like isoform X2 [Nasonia vitripennis]|uniref:Uncharacterized protein n=1 Tax=Nasonia vitripennis TaxID=7425 RepID=A0A7M7R2L1_NASVI|nr:GRIP and coiled-coil domain-containing protein 2-like isoform X2 [Nasonia vitripennis]